MNCESCEDLLVDHLHRELEPEARDSVHAHLAACGSCARACCRLAAELEDIADAHVVRPPAALRESIRSAVEKQFAPPWYLRLGDLLRRPVPAYGALALALLPLLYLASPLSGPHASSKERGTANAATSEARLKRYDASATLGLSTLIF